LNRQYFVTDIDGTLLRSDASVSDLTVEVINRVLAEGHVVSFATARSLLSARPLVSRIHWTHPIIIYNGALVVDPEAESILWGKFISKELTTSVLTVGRHFDVVPLLFGIDSDGQQRVWHESAMQKGPQRFAESRSGDPRFGSRDPLTLHSNEQVMMLTYIAREAQLVPFKTSLTKTFGDQVHIHFTRDTYLRDFFFLEISHPEANKEAALDAWVSMVGCERNDVTVFGDNLNDVGLFARSGRRIAVANAHAELKSIADEVVGSNDEDGVAHYIESRLWGSPD